MLGRIALFGGVIVIAAILVSGAVIYFVSPDRSVERTAVETAATPPPPPVASEVSPEPRRTPPAELQSVDDIVKSLRRSEGAAEARSRPQPARRRPPKPPPDETAALSPARESLSPPPQPAPGPGRSEPVMTASVPRDAPTAAEPAPSRASESAALLASINPILDRVPCAVLNASIVAGTVNLSGYVYEPNAIEQVKNALGSLQGVAGVNVDVNRMNELQCRLVNFFSEYLTANRRTPRGVAIRSRDPDAKFVKDERLIVDLKSPDRRTYIYVDYFSLDGGVVHLMPSPAVKRNRMAANDARTLGDRPSNGEWVVGKPFGTELIVALSTPEPLFGDRRKEVETAADYLRALEQSLTRIKGSRSGTIAADILFITTQPSR